MPSAASKAKSAPSRAQPSSPSALIKGYGALKGQLDMPDDIDWTKPIYEQALARAKRAAGRVSPKRRPTTKKARPEVAA